MWEPKRAYDEDTWTEDYLEEVLSSHARLPLPPPEQHIGATHVSWEEIEPGSFTVHSRGGSLADEMLARDVVIEQLRAYGLTQAGFMPFPAERTSAYDDVEAKAQKYWQGGAVDIKVNTPTAVEGVVDAVSHGGTGVWEPSFKRDDPNSGSITTWECTCPWDQFAWQRTRKWKYLEGRPCAHVLALYWASMATPVDPEIDPSTGQTMAPSGQMGFAGPEFDRATTPQGAPKPPASPPAGLPAAPLSIPGIVPGTAEQTPVPGPGVIPPFQGYPKPPVPTSVPGGKVPSADNPMQYPGGTFSSIRYPVDIQKWAKDDTDINHAMCPQCHGESEMLHAPECARCNNTGTVEFQIEPWAKGNWGKGFVDTKGNHYSWKTEEEEGFPHHDEVANNLGVDMAPGSYVYIDPEGNVEDANHYSEDWHFGASEVTFQNSDMVRLENEEYGIMEGKSQEHGAGQYRSIPKGSIGEVLGQDPTTGWVDVIFPIHDTGPMEPYLTRAWIEPQNLTPMPNIKKPGPFVRRRSER